MRSVSCYIVVAFIGCTDNGLCTCCVLLPPGTFPVCHRCRTRGCRTGAAFVGVRRCALTEDAFEWNLKCMRSVSRSIVVAFIVALTTSYIRVVYSCGQVLFRSVIVFGPVAVGQARLSSEFAFHQFMKTSVVF